MSNKIEDLKAKRDQLTARIQREEARLKANQTKADNRVKVLIGAAMLEQIKQADGEGLPQLVELMQRFLQRPTERAAVLGDDGQGSEALLRLIGRKP